MPHLIMENTPAGRRWRYRWREGGRGSKLHSSERFSDKREALRSMEAKRLTLATSREVDQRALIPWDEVRVRWLATKAGRYQDEARRTLELHTGTWRHTTEATPAVISKLPLSASRVAKACLRWAWLHLNQPVDARALKTAATRVRPKKARSDLLSDEEVARLMSAAFETGDGNGTIVHLVATYGHRAENLVRLTATAFAGGKLRIVVKGGAEIHHPLLYETRDLIDPLVKLHPAGPLFLNHLGVPWVDGRAFASWFNHFFHVGYYQLKRAAISRWLARGADPKTIASITGHKTVSLLLDTYAATNSVRQAAAINALRKTESPQSWSSVHPIDLSEIVPKHLLP